MHFEHLLMLMLFTFSYFSSLIQVFIYCGMQKLTTLQKVYYAVNLLCFMYMGCVFVPIALLHFLYGDQHQRYFPEFISASWAVNVPLVLLMPMIIRTWRMIRAPSKPQKSRTVEDPAP